MTGKEEGRERMRIRNGKRVQVAEVGDSFSAKRCRSWAWARIPLQCSLPLLRHLWTKPAWPEPASHGPHLLVGHDDDRQVRVLVQ